MPSQRVPLPADQSAELQGLLRQAAASWQAGNSDQALGMAAEAWARLPEPKFEVDMFPEAISFNTAKYAIANDRLPEARLWLQLARQAYGGDQAAPITQANLDFQQGCIEYKAGNHDDAFKLFDAVAQYSDQRFFTDADPAYWNFYQQRTARPTGDQTESLLPSPNIGRAPARRLNPAEEAQIQQLVNKANDLDDENRYAESEPLLVQALELIPDPKAVSGLSLQIYGALGDDYWSQGRFAQAETALRMAQQCSDGLENPFIWMRLGQALYDQHGPTDQAVDALLSAYMLDRERVFETEDPKYLAVLQQRGLVD